MAFLPAVAFGQSPWPVTPGAQHAPYEMTNAPLVAATGSTPLVIEQTGGDPVCTSRSMALNAAVAPTPLCPFQKENVKGRKLLLRLNAATALGVTRGSSESEATLKYYLDIHTGLSFNPSVTTTVETLRSAPMPPPRTTLTFPTKSTPWRPFWL